jgi:hypothetical protein
MKNLINNTKEIAYTYFKALEFPDEHIEPLLTIGMKDLKRELTKLEEILKEEPMNKEDIHNTLHALKGLFGQLGYQEMLEKLEKLEADSNKVLIPKDILRVFHIKDDKII